MEQSVDCVICNDSEDDHWITTRCGHMYHFQCLKEWVTDRNHKVCPICKRSTDEGDWLRVYTSSVSKKCYETAKFSVNSLNQVVERPTTLSITDDIPFKLSIADSTQIEHTFKIVLLGDSGTGKTAIWRRFIDDQFNERMASTIGPEFRGQKVTCCGACVELQVWDTAGQANFRSINMQYLRKSVGIIFVYAITDPASCESLKYWMDKVDQVLPHEIVKIMVGNKCDVLPEERRVQRAYGEKIANDAGLTFFETSAKSSENIQAVFKTMTTLILEQPNLVKMADTEKLQRQTTIRLHSPSKRNPKRESRRSPANQHQQYSLKYSECC